MNLDLPVDNQLTTADINVISSAASDVLAVDTASIRPKVKLEPRLAQTVQQALVNCGDGLDTVCTQRELHGDRDALRNDVAVFGRWPAFFVHSLVHHKDSLIRCNDIGAAPLDHRHLCCAIFIKVLADVVTRVARAYDEDLLSGEIVDEGGVLVLAAVVHYTLEVVLSGECGRDGITGLTCRQNDVPRLEGAEGAVCSTKFDGPYLFLLVVTRPLDVGAGPDVEFHHFRVGL